MREKPFRVPVGDGALVGFRGGQGPPALVLHGGAAVSDYMGGCARELGVLFDTIRYQQRGTHPSEVGPPYSIEAHVADAVAILDFFDIERAWVIGHSWGGHLALHLALTHSERLLGVVCLAPLGAFSDVFAEQDVNLRRGLTESQVNRIEEIEELRRQGKVTEGELLERFALLWPQWFADPTAAAPNPVTHIGPESSIGANASLSAHFSRGTLANELPGVRVRVLFVHGELDALPIRSSTATASLIPGARVETILGCGHFPWLEKPGELRRIVGSFLAG